MKLTFLVISTVLFCSTLCFGQEVLQKKAELFRDRKLSVALKGTSDALVQALTPFAVINIHRGNYDQ